MLHANFQDHMTSGSGEEIFCKVFAIYGHGGHLGHVTMTIYINFCSSFQRRFNIKFGFEWPSGFREENIRNCERMMTTTDGRRTLDHVYSISSPMSLWLRLA